jgi:hypothetical protein
VIATVPATLLAAIPLAWAIDGRLHPPPTCEGGICTLSELFFYLVPIVWVGAWIAFSLLIWIFRTLAAAGERRRDRSAGGGAA